MKKYAALAAVAVMLGVGGCVAMPPTTVDYTPPSNTDPLVAHVHDAWVGDEVPDAWWITTEATMICKRANGGLEPRVHLEGPNSEANSALMVEAALEHACAVTARNS